MLAAWNKGGQRRLTPLSVRDGPGPRRLRVEALPPDGEPAVIPCRNLILFVEDEALLHVGVEREMAAVGFSVAGVLSSDEAAHVLATQREEICALVTDVDLGCGLKGWALARRAREAIPGLPVIYTSGASAHDFEAERVAGARLVTKPYAPEHLAHVVRTILAGASPAGAAPLAARPVVGM